MKTVWRLLTGIMYAAITSVVFNVLGPGVTAAYLGCMVGIIVARLDEQGDKN